MKLNATHIFLFLCASFLVYSFSIYLEPLSENEEVRFDKEKASDGRIVWQKYNCQTCHQLYGLGGYLGPDLTNTFSTPNKGEALIKAMVTYGTKQMPAYTLSDIEMSNLVEFLNSVDASGTADPRKFKNDNFGMTERNGKK
jgi:nitric oxide reductase subunit C